MTGLPAVLHDPGQDASPRVEVALDAVGASLVIEGAGLRRAIPVAALSVAGGGWDGRTLTLAWREADRQVAVTLSGPPAEALARALPPGLAPEVARWRGRGRREARRRRVAIVVLAAFVLVPLALAAGLVLARARILDAVVRRLPVSVDTQIGQMVEGQVRATRRVLPAGPAREAVREIVRRLAGRAPAHGFTFRCEIIDHPSVNAFAAPGGFVVVHTGLITAARSADELAGVLAHEVSHVLHRHSLRQMVFRLGLSATLRLLLGGGAAETIAGAAADLGALRFSRDQERDADAGGLDLLVAARLPASGLASFFERLDGQGQGTAPPAMLSSHPPSRERADTIRRLTGARGAWVIAPIAIDWPAVVRDAGGKKAIPM